MGDVLRRREMIPIVGGTQGYVQSGLIFWLDGIDNTRNGHDSSSSTWEDLIGNKSISIYDATVETDHIAFLSTGYGSGAFNETIQNYTVEVVLNAVNVGNGWLGFGMYNNDTHQTIHPYRWNLFYSYYNNGRQLTYSSFQTAQIISTTMRVDNNSATLYYNGVVDKTVSFSNSAKTITNARLNVETAPGKGAASFYSVRVYNRALSAEEISKNYAYDRQRFNF